MTYMEILKMRLVEKICIRHGIKISRLVVCHSRKFPKKYASDTVQGRRKINDSKPVKESDHYSHCVCLLCA